MKWIITGSRSINRETTFRCLDHLYDSRISNHFHDSLTHVYHGNCINSPDVHSEEWFKSYCNNNALQIIGMSAKWNNLTEHPLKIKYNYKGEPYNALAGFNRNKKMLEFLSFEDFVVAIWNGKSSGTLDMITQSFDKVNQIVFNVNQKFCHIKIIKHFYFSDVTKETINVLPEQITFDIKL